ncbi:hypothetical protein OAT77_03035 [Alphaproteobacteria bacterium]|nr:hypothetical protein [Alphaproteobacteria bacterium]
MGTFWVRFCPSKQRIGQVRTGLKPHKSDVNTPNFCTVTPEAAGSSPVTPAITFKNIIYRGKRQNLLFIFVLFKASIKQLLMFAAESWALSEEPFAASDFHLTVNGKLYFCC